MNEDPVSQCCYGIKLHQDHVTQLFVKHHSRMRPKTFVCLLVTGRTRVRDGPRDCKMSVTRSQTSTQESRRDTIKWGAHHKLDDTITVSENILESLHDYVGRLPPARRQNNCLRKYSRTVTRLCGALTTSQTAQ
ncbi:hypothetical protein RRG08_056230 [Elysia crispata]|uniref:Uncharacterized protein n=1 Tax=Elysia crispata TaxID=231223 RepID=A0AAE0YL88_9GAST|nr:hypothetical protein RRG08_056230 [Elysia crispata]